MERDIMKGHGRFILKECHVLKINDAHIKVRCGDFNATNGLLIVGTRSGSFQLLRLTSAVLEII
jgi:hypothetical protein